MQNRIILFTYLLVACATVAKSGPPAGTQESAARVGNVAAEATPSIGLPDERAPLPRVLTGGAPDAAQLARARAAGYKTVISLLSEAEIGDEATKVRAAGLRFWSIPIEGPGSLTEANAQRLSAAMNERGAQPLIVHCASGNRVGALLALKAYYVDHASKEAALELGERAGLRGLKPVVEAQLH
jgi:protein tyrosine phosphatase (PTP) superfamily phosphohydrolase (DUF442 family)